VGYPSYPFYLVHTPTGKVLSGWDYREDAHEAKADARDDGIGPVQALTAKGVERKYERVSWADNGFMAGLRRNSGAGERKEARDTLGAIMGNMGEKIEAIDAWGKV
jgi:hypothetical protein